MISPEADSSASVVTCPANSNKCESTLRFTKESRENVHACYWFSRDPGYWKSYENLHLKVMQPGELTVESLEGFSNRGLVVNQAKVFHISGYSTQDKVYLVQSASACLEENALDGRVFQTTVLDGATGFAIVVNMTYATAAEDLKMCYQFSTLTAAGDKVEGVFHVYAVSGFDAERTVGSIDSVVAGKTKELFLLGAGFAESDMVAWVESGASCAERSQEGAMHKLVDVEAFYAVVSMNTLSAGKEFHLCYKFTNEAWNEYPALVLRVKHFAGVNGVSQGNANAFVVSQPKAFYLDDEDGVSGYSTQDKVHLVLSGQDCADASAYVYTADVEARGEAGHFQFTLDLPEALAGSVYRLCYAFGAETPVQTSSTVVVKSMPGFVGVLEGTAVDAEQSVNAVVLTKEKKLVFPANKAISDNDRFLLVKSQSECAAATAFQPINSEGAQLYFSVLRSAAEEVNTELFGCIKFNGEPALFLPQVAIRVKSFAGLTATAGDSAVLVLTQPKTFVVSAEGGASVGDSVIIASTSCEDESAANRLVFPVVASGESLQTTVTVGVEGIEPSTPRAWFLCYRFVHEKPAMTSILMEVDGFTSAEALTVSVGDKLKAVVKKEKQYAFATAQGARAGDRVALGCSCESLLTPMEELNASATATLVLATKPTCAVGVCYKFHEEPEVFYSWAMTVYELSSLNGQSAFTKDVVSGERVHEGRGLGERVHEGHGVGRALRVLVRGLLSTEDEFKLVAANADCAATLHDYSDSFGAVLPDIAVEGAMDSEDGSYTILRLGGSGDLTAYFPSMQASMVNGKWTGLNAILVDGVYAYIQKYEPSTRFLHLTKKIAVEAGATLKLVHATEMEVVASLNAYRANVTLPLTTTSEGLLKLCYAFAGDAFFAYDEYQFRVRQVSPSTLSVSGTPGHTLLKAMKNVVELAGLNLESGDKLLLVQPTERCSAVPAAEVTMTVEDGVAEVTMTVEDGVASAVMDASLEGSYRLCYKFGEIGIQNTAAVVDVVGASVTGQTSEYNAWFSVANQAHAITYTTPKSEAFEQERVPYFATMANSGYHVTGVLDSLMKPEGELILYATSAANAVFTFSTAHAADVLSRVEQFVVTIENHQLSAVTLEVTLKTGASSVMKTVTELVDGVNRVVFDASVAGWSALTFSAPVSYTIKVSSSSISIFNFQRTYSTLVFAVEGAESLKYVREACSEEPVASAVMPVGEDRTVRWLFTEGSATEQWKLCYAIGASGFVGAGVEFNMRVGEVTELVPLVGAANRVVAAMYAAGLEPWDVHVRDLLSGCITLEGFRCTVGGQVQLRRRAGVGARVVHGKDRCFSLNDTVVSLASLDGRSL